jgi:hypothetical protein
LARRLSQDQGRRPGPKKTPKLQIRTKETQGVRRQTRSKATIGIASLKDQETQLFIRRSAVRIEEQGETL